MRKGYGSVLCHNRVDHARGYVEAPLLEACLASVERGVAFSPGGQTSVRGSLDGTIRVWDLKGSFRFVPLPHT